MDKKYILENLLFVSGHPVGLKKISEIMEIPENEALEIASVLNGEYESQDRGLRLVFFENKFQLVSSPGSLEAIEKMVKSDFEEELSPASLETLAIIAYRGPLGRIAIENLRGVNCSFILQNLAIRGLIERKNNPLDGRSYIYNVSFDFLKHMGMSRIEDLPNYGENKIKNG